MKKQNGDGFGTSLRYGFGGSMVDDKINQLDSDNRLGINDDDIVGLAVLIRCVVPDGDASRLIQPTVCVDQAG
ncbi:hypothetical protein FNI11_01805 [Salmonella enterica subsp. salamae]|nr:hypothetical protein [Salmonella enterica subsp. salamae]ECJ2279661.1 hypothetical protein [Salmonella enterica subsp. salamae]